MKHWLGAKLAHWWNHVADTVYRAVRRGRPLWKRFIQRSVQLSVVIWNRRSLFTSLVRWRPLRGLDRPLAFLLRLEPRLATTRVAVRRIPFSGTLPERAALWLWEKHSVLASIKLALLVATGMVLLSLAAPHVFSTVPRSCKSDLEGLSNMIFAAAAYLGGLFGFLQAVTIFAVQLRSQQDASMLPLTPLIARRYFAFFILGSIAGVTIANLIAALAVPVLPLSRYSLMILVGLDIIALPVATLAALWYLARIISEAGDADVDVAMPVVKATMRAQAWADTHEEEMAKEYIRCLEIAGIQYNPFADSGLRPKSATSVRIPLGASGTIRDLDLHRLNALAGLLRTIRPVPTTSVPIAFGQAVKRDTVLVLTWGSLATTDSTEPAKAPVSDDVLVGLRSAVEGVFIVRKESTR